MQILFVRRKKARKKIRAKFITDKTKRKKLREGGGRSGSDDHEEVEDLR
jgi:hypothetical protein